MEEPKKNAWRENPLALGALGLLVMILGYLTTGFVPRWPQDDPEEAHLRERLHATEKNWAKNHPEEAAVQRAAPPLEQTAPLLWPGRIVFVIGLGIVIVGAVRWYRLAQLPEESESHREEAEETSS